MNEVACEQFAVDPICPSCGFLMVFLDPAERDEVEKRRGSRGYCLPRGKLEVQCVNVNCAYNLIVTTMNRIVRGSPYHVFTTYSS